MKVYTMEEVSAGNFARKNQAIDLRDRAEKFLPEGEEVLLTDLIKHLTGRLDLTAYASVRTCFTPRNGFRVFKRDRRMYVMREGINDQ